MHCISMRDMHIGNEEFFSSVHSFSLLIVGKRIKLSIENEKFISK